MASGPRAYTAEEARDIFLEHLQVMAGYWATQEGSKRDVCMGLVFSVLTAIDGCAGGVPFSLDLVTCTHPDDKAFRQGEGENWIEAGTILNENELLHETWSMQYDNKE